MKKVMGEDHKAPTQAAIDKALAGAANKSKKMVALFDLGLEVKEIHAIMEKHLGEPLRYNFVYNVVSNHCNVNGIATATKDKENKKDRIIEMFLAGKSNKEISIELKTNYNYVFNTLKKYKAENPQAATTEAAAGE
jgi:DNA-binding NarL/FixJ family response regulator